MNNLSQTPADDFLREDLEKALISARGFRKLFVEPFTSVPPEDGVMTILPYEKWNELLYMYVQHGLYEVIGSFTGPDGRPYAAAYILSDEEVTALMQEQEGSAAAKGQGRATKPLRTIRNYKNLSVYSYECMGGIALLEQRELSGHPQARLNFGSVWSSVHYHHPAGCPNVVDAFKEAYEIAPYDPFSATISESGEQQWGEPSDEFLPPVIRQLMVKEIQKYIPGLDVEILLLRREKYAMPDRIVVDTHADYTDAGFGSTPASTRAFVISGSV